ncbi:hypothetical protein EV648_10317 [Kribbella sp. VKM Ac-2568]|nr:hypothetical protein EV648_10317 [Kribbella sp. VKM Ac-2568]
MDVSDSVLALHRQAVTPLDASRHVNRILAIDPEPKKRFI